MKTISVNAISRKYEQLHKKYEKTAMKDERFFAINNAMIFSYFSMLNGLIYDGTNSQEIIRKIEKIYGMALFFYNVKKTTTYKLIFEDAIKVFSDLFGNEIENGISLENLLGNVLEKHINQKDTGSYYTPDDTTSYISWNSILIAVLNKCPKNIREELNNLIEVSSSSKLLNSEMSCEELTVRIQKQASEKAKKMFCENIYKVTIIDPTCGSGAFVIKAFECKETILRLMGATEINYNRILDSLYGVDISKEAIHLTKLRLLMKIATKSCNMTDFNVMFAKNFIVADSLKGSDFLISEPGFDWKSFGFKFDCIIGNPPYVEMSKYVSEQFETFKCGNLYAYTIERACNIAHDGSVISFIVPLPFIATPRMQTAKNYLEKVSSNVYYSMFADRPGCIFTGVHQRLTIFIAEIGEQEKLERYSSAYNYWYNNERKELFSNVRYYKNQHKGILPKIGNELEDNIYIKLKSGKDGLSEFMCEKSDYPVYLSTRIGFWTKAFKENVFTSREYKVYYATSETAQYLLLAILNSSIFYYFWVVTSDCWHITNKNLTDLRIDKERINEIDLVVLKETCEHLMADLEKNKKYIGSKQTEYEYKHKYSKPIIDKLDEMIKYLFALQSDEVEYIKRYTEKYRVNTMED